MLKKTLITFLPLACLAVFANDDEITIKATGDFAKEVKELVEKYKDGGANGSIEIILDENTQATGGKSLLQNELIEKSQIEKTMQEDITLDKTSSNESTREVYDKHFSSEKSGANIVSLLLDGAPIEGDAIRGKTLYDNKCAQCHGQKAEKSSYANARNLITLPKKDIVEQIRSYKRDTGYGKNTAVIMRTQAITITDEQTQDIAAYIESLKNR